MGWGPWVEQTQVWFLLCPLLVVRVPDKPPNDTGSSLLPVGEEDNNAEFLDIRTVNLRHSSRGRWGLMGSIIEQDPLHY